MLVWSNVHSKDFYTQGDRKITLNFALADNMPLDPEVLLEYFNPDKFIIKITPVNPTAKAVQNKLSSYISTQNAKKNKKEYSIVNNLNEAGYDVILSIGELEENKIGSNCGQYLTNYQKESLNIKDGYTYGIVSV